MQEVINNIAKELNVSKELATIMYNRRIDTVEKANAYLFNGYEELSSPFVYSGMKEAVDIINKHIKEKSRIVIYGDYDCDGVSSVSILVRAFRDIGIDAKYYIPIRQDEGYGLNNDALFKIKQEIDPQLLITVDCGITAVEEIEYAQELGMEVVVTDHHTLGENLPNCTVIDPCIDKGTTPLCGAGVAFFLVRALLGDKIAKKYVDICSLATVADIVPLLDDNRIIVKTGLEEIKNGNTKIGIDVLIKYSGIDRKNLTSYDIGFKLAPRLNASGRLNVAHSSAQLLLTDDITEARFIVEELSIKNTERQEIGKRIFDEAMEELVGYDFISNGIIVLRNKEWNEGVIGIAAARITEYFNMPTILLTETADGMLKGSARSIHGINIVELIGSQKSRLFGYGGHAMAAGLSLDKSQYEYFFNGIIEECKKIDKNTYDRKISYEMELSINNLTSRFYKEIELLEPYGFRNPKPTFLDKSPDFKLSRIKVTSHAKGKIKGAEIVGFGKWNKYVAFCSAMDRSVTYSIGYNVFNGQKSNQITIKELFAENIFVAKDTLLVRIMDFSHNISGVNILRKGFNENPTLDVFFDMDSYEKFVSINREVYKVYAEVDNFCFCDTAVLSPSVNFPFGYYGKIIVHGKITETMKRFFDILSAEYCEEKFDFYDILRDLSIDDMRRTYKELRSFDGIKFSVAEEIFYALCRKGYEMKYHEFLTYFSILADVGLIKFVNNDILRVNNIRTDITKSPIYRYIYG